jgi:hypothetical protein
MSRVDTEDDITMESNNSQSGRSTPMASNPGTPRSSSVMDTDFRNTPTPTTAGTGVRNTPPPAGMSHYTSAASAPASITNVSAIQRSQSAATISAQSQSKYTQLLAVIEDMGRDIRPTYSGSRTSVERLKRGIVHARILVRECLMECERAART